MSTVDAWYVLACAQLGARATLRLLEVFQSPEAIVDATPTEWAARARLSASGCARLLEAANRNVSAELARLERLGMRLLDLYHAEYPARLRSIADPPPVLFIKGDLRPADQQAIAMVGSRSASPYGRHVAAELAAALAARGFTVVSGMALGADAAAHEGCLRAGGRTIAVLGSGLDVVYPPEHLTLYERIAAAGAVSANIRWERHRRAAIFQCATASSAGWRWAWWWWKPQKKAAHSSPPGMRWNRGAKSLPSRAASILRKAGARINCCATAPGWWSR